MTAAQYPLVSSETIYEGRIVALRRDSVRMSDGHEAIREVVVHLGAVGIVAIDEDGCVLMVNQYRHPVQQRLDELPAGLLDVPGEPALDAAKRELAEEAGVVADEWNVLIDMYTSPGISDEAIRVYLARGLHPAPDVYAPEHEELTMTVSRVPLASVVDRALSGELTNAAAVAGLLAAAHAQQRGWAGLRPADAPWAARPDRAGQ